MPILGFSEDESQPDFLKKIREWWGSTPKKLNQYLPDKVKSLLNSLDTTPVPMMAPPPQPPPQVPPPAPGPQQMSPQMNYAAPPMMAPQMMPTNPPPQRQPRPQPQAPGMGMNDALAQFIAQQQAQKQAKQQQVMQLVNSIMGPPQTAKKPTRKEMLAQALPMLGSTLTQFGGAMMTPAPWRGQAMAGIGQGIPNYMQHIAQQRGRQQNQEENRYMKALALMPHIAKMVEGNQAREAPHMVINEATGETQVSPYPVTKVGKAPQDPRTYEAAEIAARLQGDNEMADYYANKKLQVHRENLTLGYDRLNQGYQRMNQPGYVYNPETDEPPTQVPHGTKLYRPSKQGGAGSVEQAIGMGGGGKGEGTHFLKDAQGNIKKVDEKTYQEYLKHYGLQE